jgi:glycosyltransferase involved in cell wall biosynthesis
MHSGAIKRLSQRAAELPSDKVTAFNLLGVRYKLELGRPSPIGTHTTESYLYYGKAFLKKVISSKKLNGATMVYTFTGTGLELMQAAKKWGLSCAVEQMSVPMRYIYTLPKEEADRWPGWQTQYGTWDQLAWSSREAEEWALADAIIAPSEHIRVNLITAGVPPTKIVTIPYAVAPEAFKGQVHSYNGSRPLRVLFVGRVELLKGIPYLLEALHELGPKYVQARLVGRTAIHPEKLALFQDVVQVVGQVSRAEVISHYNWADVLVLPSLCEGSATVTYEARACGLPIVATPNAGAWIRDGQDGTVVLVREIHMLAEALRQFIHQPLLVQRMSEAALDHTRCFSWQAYQQRLSALVETLHRERHSHERQK